ncbi:sulfatase-like hydrolase/transferase [Methylobacillus sp.]|uniref:sulfatase-like hydrolase/transferase n=1 Tax=Methylobacillus sp. TaxID=56818 RepID=UPI002FE292FC
MRNPKISNGLIYFYLLSYLPIALLASDSIKLQQAWQSGAIGFIFVLASWLCYSAYYLLPSALLTWLTYRLSSQRAWPTYITAVVSSGLTTLLLYANAKLYALYGTFINGFIINLVTTPGGIESLGGSTESSIGFALIALGFLALQAILLFLAIRFVGRRKEQSSCSLKWGWLALLVLTIGIHLGYAAHDATGKTATTEIAEQIPFFQTVTAKSLFKKLGMHIAERPKLRIDGRLNYPLQPLSVQEPAKPYNIVWLIAESWRADMLNPDVMPRTWKFAQQAQNFTRNYSGGNGTRMGVFSMFTGLPGNYWFPFLRDHRGAAIIDVLQEQGYDISLYTSALFSYPEFDRTIFSHVPADRMQALQKNGQPGWVNDRQNVSDLLRFIDTHDQTKPFFGFLFFESPHARYYFPEESVIRRPYKDDINYATLSREALKNDMGQIKNRYINAVHHLDSQFGRILDYLEKHQLLDNTIVILAGDHGEEFMERGYWGHNSTFVDEQVRTPLVLWIPGTTAKVHDKLTSHMDVIPTLMPYLGVQNPATDYAMGSDLLHGPEREYLYMSDWSRIAYMDHDIKLSMNISGYAKSKISSANDEPLNPAAQAEAQKRQAGIMLKIMQDLTRFLDKKS